MGMQMPIDAAMRRGGCRLNNLPCKRTVGPVRLKYTDDEDKAEYGLNGVRWRQHGIVFELGAEGKIPSDPWVLVVSYRK